MPGAPATGQGEGEGTGVAPETSPNYPKQHRPLSPSYPTFWKRILHEIVSFSEKGVAGDRADAFPARLCSRENPCEEEQKTVPTRRRDEGSPVRAEAVVSCVRGGVQREGKKTSTAFKRRNQMKKGERILTAAVKFYSQVRNMGEGERCLKNNFGNFRCVNDYVIP